MIYFSNPGSFDIRLLSVFGVSAKPNSSNPIGKFGTGLKNAVAGVLRLGGTVTIHSDGKEYTIFSRRESFRGQDHDMVYMLGEEEIPLSFSLALGSHWEPWMIYREFFGNQLDEQGPAKPSLVYPIDGEVIFCINCPEVEEIFHRHNDYFLDSSPIHTLGNVEIHPPSSGGTKGKVFLNHILVHTSEKPFLYTYNFTSGLTLTEDRTVHEWNIRSNLVSALANNTTPESGEVVKAILEAKKSFKECVLDFSYIYNASKDFEKVLGASVRAGKANSSAIAYGRAYLEDIGYRTQVKTPEEANLTVEVEEAVRKLLEAGPLALPDPSIYISDEVEESCLFVEYKEDIYLSPKAFASRSLLFKTIFSAFTDIMEDHSNKNSSIFFILETLAFGEMADAS
jgi:hypothetical protein